MYLKQSTASQEILLGRFVDSTDGNTAETGLTIANTDIKIWKEGATTLADKNSGGATHISGGMYYAVLDATDTNTLGNLEVHVQVAGALSVARRFTVLSALVYDSLIDGSDNLQVDMIQQAGTTVYNRDFTLSAYAANVITLPSTYADSSSLPDDDRYTDCWMQVVGGLGKGTFLRTTTAGAGAREYNIEAPIVAPDNTSQIIVLGKCSLEAGTKTKTDQLTFTVSNVLDTNMTHCEGSSTIDGKAIDVLFQRIHAVLCGKSSGLNGSYPATQTHRNNADNADVVSQTIDASGNKTAIT
jgi:hypothetical protein